jgi:hypothetical protein
MKPTVYLQDLLFWAAAFRLRVDVLKTWLTQRDHPRRAEQIAHNKAGARNAFAQLGAAWRVPAEA